MVPSGRAQIGEKVTQVWNVSQGCIGEEGGVD